MGRRGTCGGRVALLCLAAALATRGAGAGEDDLRVAIDGRHAALLRDSCSRCHGAERSEGGFRLDTLPFAIADDAAARRWRKVLDALNAGSMPPDDEAQPPPEAKADLLDDLAHALAAARRGLAAQPPAAVLRRLNRREYKNTIRALLGVEVDAGGLPADTGSGGFDTAGSGLFMSSDQFEQYLALGREAVDEAFERRTHALVEVRARFEAEATVDRVRDSLRGRLDARKRYILWTRAVDEAAARPGGRPAAASIRSRSKDRPPWEFYHAWKEIPGAPSPVDYGHVDAETATQFGVFAFDLIPYQSWFLAQPELKDGAFLTVGDNGVNPWFTFAVGADWPPGAYVVRVRVAATKQATPDRRFLEFGVQSALLSTHEVAGTMESPQVIEIPYTMTKGGDRSFFVREKGTMDTNLQANHKQALGARANGVGPEFALWVDWAEVVRKPDPADREPPGLRALGIPPDRDAPPVGAGALKDALGRFAAEACRGDGPSPGLIDKLAAIYDRGRAAGAAHDEALKDAMAVILATPRFLYLAEPSPSGAGRPLSPGELAIRLSYLLWGAPPDAELRALAARGELSRPDVLAAQAGRLIDDPRSAGFVGPFVGQWLGLDRLEFFRFDIVRHPAFDDSVKAAARAEVLETFGDLLRRGGSLRSLLKSDSVVVNGLLARYYGIEGVFGDAFRRVDVPPGSPRGGLLGMAAILAMGGNGARTSPVERGAWVLRKLLDDPPPPAPPNVPQLSRLEGRPLTTRERLRAHQEQPQCASCHRKIDPIGLGLENFDAVGLWRVEDAGPIDPAGSLHRGPSFGGYPELRDLIAARSGGFARGFAGALLEYALGRPRHPGDDPLIAAMCDRAGAQDDSVREFLLAIVLSDEFRRK